MNRRSIFLRAITIVAVIASVNVFAQRHELGVRSGLTSMVGDIGSTNYIQSPILDLAEIGAPIYLGLLYRMNFNPYQTVRFNLGYNQIVFSDYYAKQQYRRERGKYGFNTGMEIDVLYEYNFYPINDEQKGMFSPYIFGGVGASLYSVRQVTLKDIAKDNALLPILRYDNSEMLNNKYNETGFPKKVAFSIPFGVGLKYKFHYNWMIFAELMFRPMFTDMVDYSVINERDIRVIYNKNNVTYNNKDTKDSYVEDAKRQVKEYIQQNNVGNKNSNDWVNTVSLGITYSFGRPPCYCD